MDWNLTYTKKEREGLLYENGADEKIASHSKLKLWRFFWGHSERERPLVVCFYMYCVQSHKVNKWYCYTVI